jgi:16S rRNA (guanine527-N7)-methyltransferase
VEQCETLEHLLKECSRAIGVTIDSDQTHLFLLYLKQLKIWNQSFNLTAITKDEEVIIKHFIDSLAALRAVNIETGSHIIDIGAGAGFPGIPLKIVRPDLRMTLVEPVQKKSAFLHFIVGLLQLKNVLVFQGTIELFRNARLTSTTYDYITSRALSPSLIFRNAQNFLTEQGKAILYSSKPFDRTSLPKNWSFVSDYTFELPHTYGARTISIFSHYGDSSPLTVPRGT